MRELRPKEVNAINQVCYIVNGRMLGVQFSDPKATTITRVVREHFAFYNLNVHSFEINK